MSAQIDDLLEQVALRMAEGDLKASAELLPEIMESGDDIQRQMAESYAMQLDALFAMEQEDASLTTDIPSEFVVDEDASEPEVLLSEKDEAKSPELKSSRSVTDELDVFEQPFATASTANVDHKASITEVFTETSDNLLREEKEEAKLTETDSWFDKTPDLSKEVEIQPNFNDDETIVEKSETHTLEQSQDYVRSKELGEFEMALQQAEILIADGEMDTAKVILDVALENATEAQIDKANVSLAKISSSMIAPEKVETLVPPAMQNESEMQKEEPPLFVDASLIGDIFKNESSGVVSDTRDDYAIRSTEISSPLSTVNQIDQKFTQDNNLDASKDLLEQSSLRTANDLNQALQNIGVSTNEVNLPPELDVSQHSGNQKQGFFVGEMGLMIDFSDGDELIEMPRSYRVPNSPYWMLGLTNLHGSVIPIVDLASFWGVETTVTSKKSMLLFLRHDERKIGIVINGLPQRVFWSNDELADQRLAPVIAQNHLTGAYKVNNQVWFELNVDALIDAFLTSVS